MRTDIIDNKFEATGITGKYEILNPNNLEYDMNCIYIIDSNNNKKFIPSNITETTCDIIINPNYVEPNE